MWVCVRVYVARVCVCACVLTSRANPFPRPASQQKFKVEVCSMNEEVIEFDMIGINAALANTFRRILIAEVPTMAIEQCYIHSNTSIM